MVDARKPAVLLAEALANPPKACTHVVAVERGGVYRGGRVAVRHLLHLSLLGVGQLGRDDGQRGVERELRSALGSPGRRWHLHNRAVRVLVPGNGLAHRRVGSGRGHDVIDERVGFGVFAASGQQRVDCTAVLDGRGRQLGLLARAERRSRGLKAFGYYALVD